MLSAIILIYIVHFYGFSVKFRRDSIGRFVSFSVYSDSLTLSLVINCFLFIDHTKPEISDENAPYTFIAYVSSGEYMIKPFVKNNIVSKQ